MSKINIDDLEVGCSPLTDEVYVGVKNKAKTQWLKKKCVTNSFLEAVIARWENKKETITSGENEWEVSVRKIK